MSERITTTTIHGSRAESEASGDIPVQGKRDEIGTMGWYLLDGMFRRVDNQITMESLSRITLVRRGCLKETRRAISEGENR